MDFILSPEQMQNEVLRLESLSSSKILFYRAAGNYFQNVLDKYRVEIRLRGFKDIISEIYFFKEAKQVPQTNILYYSFLLKHSLKMEVLGKQLKKEYLLEQLKIISAFLSASFEFFSYYESGAKDLDTLYFTRNTKFDLEIESQLIKDPDFCTAKDLLLSQVLANRKILLFLEDQIEYCTESGLSNRTKDQIQWTSSKAALTELIYAIHLSGSINNGSHSLKQLIKYFQIFFNTDLGDYHHTFLRLRDRSNPSKFLDSLKSTLLERMEDLDS